MLGPQQGITVHAISKIRSPLPSSAHQHLPASALVFLGLCAALPKEITLPEKFMAVYASGRSSLVSFVFPGNKICPAFSVREVSDTNSAVEVFIVSSAVNELGSDPWPPLLAMREFVVPLAAQEGTPC